MKEAVSLINVKEGHPGDKTSPEALWSNMQEPRTKALSKGSAANGENDVRSRLHEDHKR